MNLLLFNRRFSGGFGSRDYRTSQSGSGGSTRPGGSVGGPRTSGGGSYPNYSAPPPTHGTKNKKTKQNSLGYTLDSNSKCFLLLFRCCCLLHASLFLLLMRPVRKQKKKSKTQKPFHHSLVFSYLYWVCGVFIYFFDDCLERKNYSEGSGRSIYFFCLFIILKRSAPTGTLMLPALSWESS